MTSTLTKPFLALSLLLSACSSTHVVDSVDELFELFPLHGPSGHLHGDYVVGADIDLYVIGDHEDVYGWTLESEDPTVVQIGQLELSLKDQTEYKAKMVGVGDTTVWAVDKQDHRHSPAHIHVGLPDQVDLVPSGPLFVDDDMVTSNAPQIVENGVATFYVRYEEAGRPLYGSGGLTATADSGVNATTEATFLGTRRDWVEIDAPNTTGTSSVHLSLIGQEVASFPLSIVPDSSIDSVRLLAESESHHHKGDSLALLAQSFTSDSQPVWGAAYEFTIDGVKQPTTIPDGFGGGSLPVDMYIYTYDQLKPVMVEAAHNSLSDGIQIHSDGGFVASSANTLACSAVPGRPSSAPWTAGLLFALAVIARRRRSARAS